MQPRRIAVFGAGGFLGSHVVPALLGRGNVHIHAVDISFDKLEHGDERVTLTRGSIRDPELLQSVVNQCDLVLSLTALCNPSLYNTRPLDVIESNYADLVPLCDLCADLEKRLVHFSTCEVYGRFALDMDGDRADTMNEDQTALVLGPVPLERWTYACAKQLLERRIWALGKHRALRFTIIRPFNVIGPRMDFVPDVDGVGIPRVLACFMHALMTHTSLPLVNGGLQRRSFIAVEDFVEAVARVTERAEVCDSEVINIGNPQNNVSIADLAHMIAGTYAARVPDAPTATYRTVEGKDFYGEGYDDTSARIPDISKAHRLLDWEPRISLEEALPAIVDDYVNRYSDALQARAKV